MAIHTQDTSHNQSLTKQEKLLTVNQYRKVSIKTVQNNEKLLSLLFDEYKVQKDIIYKRNLICLLLINLMNPLKYYYFF